MTLTASMLRPNRSVVRDRSIKTNVAAHFAYVSDEAARFLRYGSSPAGTLRMFVGPQSIRVGSTDLADPGDPASAPASA